MAGDEETARSYVWAPVLAVPARTVVWAAVYSAAIVAGWLTAAPASGHVLFWPASGVAALWLQQTPRRLLSATVALLLAGTALLGVVVGVPVAPAIAYALATGVMACSARWVMARHGTAPDAGVDTSGGSELIMGSTRGVVALAGAAVTAGVLSAPVGLVAVLLQTGDVSTSTALGWMVRSTTGVFVVAGLGLAVVATRHARRRGVAWADLVVNERRPDWPAELGATAVVTVVAMLLVFDRPQGMSLAFLLVALSAYVGFRFAPLVTSVYITAAGSAAILATLADLGPFSSIPDPEVRALVVRVFVLVQTAVALTLSWAIRERHEMAVELIEARRDADERARLLDAVTDRLHYGVAVIDDRGRVLVRNSAAARMVPGPADQITETDHPGRYGVRRADGEPLDLAAMPHAVALTTGEPASASFVVRREARLVGDIGGGTDTYVSVRADPLDLAGPDDRRLAVVSMRDDTAHRQHVRDLETFTGAVAHDLRNPLAAMTTWVEVLTDHLRDRGVHDDDTVEALGRITATGARMGRLIGDLLDYATASSAPLDLQPVDLETLVADVTEEVAAAGGRDPVVTFTGQPVLVADPVLIRQVLANVVGNAVKYTADDVRPFVEVTAGRDADRAVTVVEVTDNGVGVPEEMRTTVFDGFTRVRATARSRSGAGLGLAICARAVERHGGTIALGPAPGGQGSTVTITVPHPPEPLRH
ncbi:MASE1 domain-containing protein [Nocardioides sp. J2M5]|uniref:ATP-binding protein n=1 Tax=Nocardioides palaemonis TaxID=2829810 RepID=UPI001BA7EC16|nr:ATP-binding protein [Nocardioides palaemonis]MBS2938363.1 MASE1 domain-containing protein [Nocardioides palaemonis]